MRLLLAVLFAAAAGLAAAQPAPAQDGHAAPSPKLLTIVATPEPQTQLMAMVLTMQAVQQGAQARILLCGPGGDIGLIDAPDAATAPQAPKGMSPQSLMSVLIESGVTVEVCAIYLPNAGLAPEALLPGIGVAKPPEIGAALVAEGARVLSF
jgi:hypothetical protein